MLTQPLGDVFRIGRLRAHTSFRLFSYGSNDRQCSLPESGAPGRASRQKWGPSSNMRPLPGRGRLRERPLCVFELQRPGSKLHPALPCRRTSCILVSLPNSEGVLLREVVRRSTYRLTYRHVRYCSRTSGREIDTP